MQALRMFILNFSNKSEIDFDPINRNVKQKVNLTSKEIHNVYVVGKIEIQSNLKFA